MDNLTIEIDYEKSDIYSLGITLLCFVNKLSSREVAGINCH